MSESAKYKIIEALGAGGMGNVYRGMLVGQAGFQRPIVIKQLRHAQDSEHVRLFVDEARRYAVLDHENIGRIFDFEEVGGELNIILEYIDGWSLVEYLARHKEADHLPNVELSILIVSRVCRALQYVFEKAAIAHRDISPGNIMITREGTVKLIDFGIATRSGTQDRVLTGKPAYMAPEMIAQLRADNRSDIFSLGVVLFEMLTGERLFTGSTTTEVLSKVTMGVKHSARDFSPDMPAAVLVILRKALERDPDNRFQTAAAMGEACEHFLYDKGYGPTNLTLKQYLGGVMPGAGTVPAESSMPTYFPVVQASMIPIEEGVKPPTLDAAAAAAEEAAKTQIAYPVQLEDDEPPDPE